jgi:hypothetical protein
MIVQLHIDWSILGLGATSTQLDDDGHPTIKWKPNTTHMRGSALQLFGLFHHSDVIFMVAHSFDY